MSCNVWGKLISILTPSCACCRSFTDIAFMDFLDTRRGAFHRAGTDYMLTAAEYTQDMLTTYGRPPQSLNDFKDSCVRLAAAGQLPMSLAECEAKRVKFGQAVRIIR